MWTERFAPAKVNLFLHVGPVGGDRYHPVSSLMVFADVGDRVRLRRAEAMAFRLDGDFAGALEGETDNLVVRARDQLLAAAGGRPPPFEIVLEKALPIAAGLGGGSADAAAALGLIADHLAEAGLAAPPERLDAIARGLGADVTACLASRSVLGRGRGDDLSPAPPMPPLDAVLVNPRAASPTGPVYRAYDAGDRDRRADDPVLPDALNSPAEVVAWLKGTRNDLQAPAMALQPAIGEVMRALSVSPETLFARMSGSGATCFAITRDAEAARGLASRLSEAHPGWWVKPCRLGG